MYNKKDIVEKFYNDNWLGKFIEEYRINIREDEKVMKFILSNINQINEYKDFNEYIEYFSKECWKNIRKNIFDKNNSLEIEKNIINIKYPFILNIQRLEILSNALTEEQEKIIFGISILDIINITYLIILRLNTYNIYNVYKERIVKKNIIKVFGTKDPTCWFSAENINIFNKNIKLESIKKYFELFSINIEAISEEKDTIKIIKENDNYTLIYFEEFCTYIFNECERLIITYFKNLEGNKLNSYYEKRGKSFEKYVRFILENRYNKIIKNAKYIDNISRKMELDNLIIKDDICLNFECKSSKFDIYDCNTDNETIETIKKAFGRGYYSINTFHETIEKNRSIIELEIENKKRKINLGDKKVISFNVTLYPVEFLSTSIHFLNEELIKNISTFPITINIIDLCSIFGICNYKGFEYYAKERFFSINCIKKLKIDYDEIEAFGFILDRNTDTYKIIKELGNLNQDIRQEIIINNGKYREELNQELNERGIGFVINNFIEKELREIIKTYYTIKEGEKEWDIY